MFRNFFDFREVLPELRIAVGVIVIVAVVFWAFSGPGFKPKKQNADKTFTEHIARP